MLLSHIFCLLFQTLDSSRNSSDERNRFLQEASIMKWVGILQLVSFIGDSHGGQVYVCHQVAMVIWSLTLIAAKTCPWGRPRQTRLGHVYVHDYRRGTFLLYWNDERIVAFLLRVESFLSVSFKVTHFYARRPTSTIVRCLGVNWPTHDWPRLS